MTTLRIRDVDVVAQSSAGVGGQQPTLIWGHGLTSSRAAEDASGIIDWDVLAGRLDVVRYDAIGHGDSGDAPELGRSHWRELALDQLALHAQLSLDASVGVVVGGASMGAATALHLAVLAATRPELATAELRGLVLMIPPTAWETRAGQTDLYETLGTIAADGGPEAVIEATAAAPVPDPLVGDETHRPSRHAALRAFTPERLAAAFRGAADTDLPTPSEVAAIGVPTLILAWTGDPGHPMSTAERLHELIDDSTLRVASTRDDLATWTDEIAAFVSDPG